MKINPHMSRQAGVTLIELMTVLLILAILASIAVPSYRRYLIRANRSDAKSALMQMQVAQEKYFLQFNKYTDKVTDAPPTGLGLVGTTTHGYYALTVALKDASAQAYTASATPVPGGGQADDSKCNAFTITDTGTRGITGDSGDKDMCWR